MKVEVDVLVYTAYGLCGHKATLNMASVKELRRCVKSRGGRPGLPVPNSPYGLCGRKATLNMASVRDQELCESGGDRPGLPLPNGPYGLCGRKATLNLNMASVFS